MNYDRLIDSIELISPGLGRGDRGRRLTRRFYRDRRVVRPAVGSSRVLLVSASSFMATFSLRRLILRRLER